MKNGIYRVEFQTPLGQGTGVVMLQDGVLQGGDSMMYYVGAYEVSGNDFSARVDTDQHSSVPGMTSALGPARTTLTLQGTFNGDVATVKGTTPSAPGFTLNVRMSLLKAA